MEKTRIILFVIVGAALLVVLLFVYGFFTKGGGQTAQDMAATLEFWGVFDGGSVYKDAFLGFQTVYPNVEINYRAFGDVERYERVLLDALAAGVGPDIFMVRNNDLFRKQNKIYPLPVSKYYILDVRHDFPEIVERDFVRGGSAYALPLSIDTLALIYNRDLFNESAVVFPPETWEKFQEVIPKLTRYDEDGKIIQAGAAIGRGGNIDKAKDLLSLLMLQSGGKMVNEDYSSAVFSGGGVDALNFYIQFADSSGNVYTWDDYLPNSVDAFAQGKTAMIFNYASTVLKIKSQSPFVKMKIAPIPQPAGAERAMAFGRYWGYTVSAQSGHSRVAWDFILHLTTETVVADGYAQKTGNPPALSALINKYINDPDLDIFARQALIARSWVEPDPEKVTNVFENAIDSAAAKEISARSALSEAASRVTDLMRK